MIFAILIQGEPKLHPLFLVYNSALCSEESYRGFYDGKSQSYSVTFAFMGRITSIKAFPNSFHFLRWDLVTVVLYRYFYFIVFFFRRNQNFSVFFEMAQGVAKVVVKDFFNGFYVGVNIQLLGHFGFDFRFFIF